MAFGDSITWGTASPALPFLAAPPPPPSYSYPTQLNGLLSGRYVDQRFTMANEGWPGEAINDGLSRLPSALSANTPEVLLLLDGANDLLGNPSSATTQYIASKLRDMVRAAKGRIPTIKVLLALFPPQYHGSVPYDRGAGAAFVPELNQRIAAVAQSEGATLVDLYTPLVPNLKQNIGGDGLHPTEQGFTLIAQTFAQVIQQTFEVRTILGAPPPK
jgi:lysophospholipase L1-like esterase